MSFPPVKSKTIGVVVMLLPLFTGCKKETPSTSPPPPVATESAERLAIDRERLKVEKDALYQHKKEEIERAYKEEIAKANAAMDDETKMYIKMLDDGLLTKAQVDKHLDTYQEICSRAHKMASDDAMRKLNQLDAKK